MLAFKGQGIRDELLNKSLEYSLTLLQLLFLLKALHTLQGSTDRRTISTDRSQPSFLTAFIDELE